ncbi:DeoR/GlpR family DNA-binding transcription regulator [Oscillospiraceae bacterium MB08-C2-2]|nr:DeoR/GlpR family DNA-binding transcription regulator [Oscillospiraceae bacterium MB08-C2-2]
MRSKRINEIENYIFENGTVSLDNLCQKFGVSKNTIRRDVDEIVARGTIRKIYGGVSVRTAKEMTSFDERNVRNLAAKKRIAAKAAQLVEDGDVIFIDSGTTTRHMIEFLKNVPNLTIITNNLEVIVRAVRYKNINVLSLSGTLDRKTLSFVGPSAVDVLQSFNISKAFMSSTGISSNGDVTHSSPLEYDIKRMVAQNSQQVYLLVDASKFYVVSLMTFCSLKHVNAMITDQQPPDSILSHLRGNNQALYVAE